MKKNERLLKFYESKRIRNKSNITFDEFIDEIKQIILNNTNNILHNRIINKFENLKFDCASYNNSSEYKYENDTIYIDATYAFDKNVYIHEIMHYLGTHKEKSTVKIGQNVQAFYRIDNDNILKINFGHGANEGLNQHYTESFLKNICPIQEVFLSYSFSANVMANLEKIIGESNTKFAHFSGNGLEFLTKKIKQCCFLPNENKALKLIM